jgi:hypothetical protein
MEGSGEINITEWIHTRSMWLVNGLLHSYQRLFVIDNGGDSAAVI